MYTGVMDLSSVEINSTVHLSVAAKITSAISAYILHYSCSINGRNIAAVHISQENDISGAIEDSVAISLIFLGSFCSSAPEKTCLYDSFCKIF